MTIETIDRATALAALWIQHGLVLPAEHPARTAHDDAVPVEQAGE